MTPEERKQQNVRFDIENIIMREFFQFGKREPKQFENIDWNNPFCAWRFKRGIMIAMDKILEKFEIKEK